MKIVFSALAALFLLAASVAVVGADPAVTEHGTVIETSDFPTVDGIPSATEDGTVIGTDLDTTAGPEPFIVVIVDGEPVVVPCYWAGDEGTNVLVCPGVGAFGN